MYKILICDDEKDIVNAIRIYLETAGYATVTARNGKEAVEINDDVHEFRPAGDGVLILTDYSEKRGEGELFFVKGGKSEKIDDEVQRIFYFSIAP